VLLAIGWSDSLGVQPENQEENCWNGFVLTNHQQAENLGLIK
jgi:hypothetical protein